MWLKMYCDRAYHWRLAAIAPFQPSQQAGSAKFISNVTATIAPSTSGPTEMVRDFVDLVPGQRRTVKLGGLRPQPGVPTTLTVKIDAAPGQVNVADTTKTIAFVLH